MKKETWTPITGYGIWYEVSNHGRVRSFIKRSNGQRVKRDEPLVKREHYSEKFAYLSVELSKGMGVKKTMPIHILVATAYVKNPNPKKYKYVNHKDGDKLNNYYENLEWCTQGQNQKHAYDTGLRKKPNGSLNGRCILTETQVLEIFNSKENQYKLASEYGVSQLAIGNIISGKSWSSVTGKNYVPIVRTRLTDKDILNIFNSTEVQIDICKKYNVSRSVISGIRTGRSYPHITGKIFSGNKEYTYYGIKSSVYRRA